MSSVTQAPIKSRSSKAGTLRHIHIEPADNGYMVRTEREGKKEKGNTFPSFQEPSKDVFNSAEDTAEHVRKTLADHEGASDVKIP